jgi:peptidoglycan/xylan/chitin deacetylase (PgdA/CDA1 family)
MSVKSWFHRKILGFLVKTNGLFSTPLFAGKGLVFMLHRVLPEVERNEFTLNRDLAITPEKLEEFILFFKEKGYIFISLDALGNWLDNKQKLNKKFICLTFDDGYEDNLTHGLPILKKHQVPATIYITNCFPNGTAILWWYLFEDHVKSFNQLILNTSLGSCEFYWKDKGDAFRQFDKVSKAIKTIPAQELQSVLFESFGLSDADITQHCKEVALSWKEIRELSNEPLITIGAHTMYHLSMKQQSECTVIEEMKASKLEIEKHIGKLVNHFAYPFGSEFDVSNRDLRIAASVGFKTSVLNQAGNIFKRNKTNKQALARMPLGNNTDMERLLNYLNGIYHFSENGFKKQKYSKNGKH